MIALQKNGLVAAERAQPWWCYKRPDTNLFMTVSCFYFCENVAGFALNSAFEQQKSKFLAAAESFKHHSGIGTYNFYPRGQHFNHGRILSKFRHFKLADDLDDTALFYFVAKKNKEEVQWLQQKAISHAGSTQNTPEVFRNLQAYSTWFGDHMPVEYDFCVLCNALMLFRAHDLPECPNDLDSLFFIKTCLESDGIQPHEVSQNYPRWALMYFHWARLLVHAPALKSRFDLDLIKAKMNLFISMNDLSELDLSLVLWAYKKVFGIRYAGVIYVNAQLKTPFFVAGFLSGFSNKFVKYLSQFELFRMHWYSTEFDKALNRFLND